jgi:hypothetical protein
MNEAERTLASFVGAYGVTGVLLFTAMLLGHKGRVSAHILFIVLFLAGFGATLYFAERTGSYYNFDAHAKAIHMPCAYAGTLSALLPVGSGLLHWRKKAPLLVHRVAIALFLVAFVAASGTGIYMVTTRVAR